MFRGRFEHTIDEKGRVSLPAKYREILNLNYDNRLILTNFDHCLLAYPHEEWLKVEEKVKDLPLIKEDSRAFKRFFISGVSECNVDRQGRILIPPILRNYAKLERVVVFVGQITYFEIWNKDRWDELLSKVTEGDIFNEVAGEIGL